MDGSTFFSDGKRQIDFVLVYSEHDDEERKKLEVELEESETDGEEQSGEETSTRRGKATNEFRANHSKQIEERQRMARWLSLKSLQNAEERRKSRAARYRTRFEADLRKKGLQIELVPPDEISRRSYVLIHCPEKVLEENGEMLRIKVPVKNSLIAESNQSNTDTRKDISMNEEKKPSLMRQILGKLFEKNFDVEALQDKKKNRFEPFVRNQKERFCHRNNEVFSAADRARIVYHILRSTPFGSKDPEKVGIERLLRAGAYSAAYPLHQSLRGDKALHSADEDVLNQRELLARHWASLRSFRMRQPLDLIRDYFGAKTGLYFAFLGVYTRLLTIASLLGIVWLLAVLVMYATDRSAIDEVCHDNETILCPICDGFCDFRKMSSECFMAQISYMFDQWGVLIVGIGITIWAQIFLQLWKRAQSSLTYRWGLTDSFYQEHTIRLDFKLRVKTIHRDPVTNNQEPYLTKKKKALNLVTNIFLVIVVAAFIIGTSFLTFFLRRFIDEMVIKLTRKEASDTFNTLFSSAVVATFHLVIILVFNWVYRLLMYRLVEWECPRTQVDFDNAFIVKIFVAEFFNTNSSLFFIAFIQPLFGKHWTFLSSSSEGLGIRSCYSNCFVELSIQMAIIFIGIQLVKTIVESIIPVLIKRGKICRARIGKWRKERNDGKEYQRLSNSTTKPQWENDFYLCMNEPHFLCYEYAELVMQFSVLVLFAPAFPLAALFALVNNLIEIRADAFKFLRLKQRPVPDEVDSIGIWTNILELIVKGSVYVNALLITFTSEFVPAMKWRIRQQSFRGYSNHSYAVFDTRHLSLFSQYVYEKSSYFHVYGNHTYSVIPQICRYYGFYKRHCINDTNLRCDPLVDSSDPCVSGPLMEFSSEWYYNMVLRLGFAIAFVFLLTIMGKLICWLLPDVPQKVADQMAKDKYFARQSLLHSRNPQKAKIVEILGEELPVQPSPIELTQMPQRNWRMPK